MLLEITDSDITYAESVLFGKTDVFDDERKAYLKKIETCDLQAVPGSGKTTVLLAKLLIIERYLPFKFGTGVLVISHTNTAVEEIKNRIGKYCPKLFSYPNFVGTIQSFVDQFLAIPCFINLYKKKPIRIDNEIYDEKIKSYNLPRNVAFGINKKHDPEGFLKSIRLDSDWNLKSSLSSLASDFEFKSKTSDTYIALLNMKKRLLDYGILHFDDAYFLAELYLKEFPDSKKLIAKRFKYIFVDEMQDMEKHQHNLLEQLFIQNPQYSVYQRIGDMNQSIFSEKSESVSKIWETRSEPLSLKGSHRLNTNLAKIVQNFGTESYIEIVGKNDSNNVKPHLLVFEKEDIEQVIPHFAKLVKEKQDAGFIPPNLKHPVKVIGWNGNDPEANKFRIKSYFSSFDKQQQKINIDYQTLDHYLTYFNRDAKTLDPIRKNILNAILRILRLESIKDDNRDFTKRKFIDFLKTNYPEKANELNKALYEWCIDIVRGKKTDVHSDINAFIPSFIINIFPITTLSDATVQFLQETTQQVQSPEEVNHLRNKFILDGLEIDITSVHSVKGETHTATLYLETFYHKHESDHCLNVLLGNKAQEETKRNTRKASKMMYVGFSRPTHLLCFAVLKDRIKNHVDKLESLGWEIKYIEDTSLADKISDGQTSNVNFQVI
jgi:DNA helicase-2/ATP-dependent DNA helicase PcrA